MRIGSLFAGYGGLTLATQAVLGGDVAWHSEIDTAASRVLDHHWPGVKNLGDVTKADWSTVPAVDILEGGYPCQPDSLAGLGLGVDDDRWLWPAYLEALTVLRPRLAVGENVRGHVQRGLRGVVADLQRAGYAVTWVVMAAASVGACHERKRVFWLAWPESDGAPALAGHPFGWLDDGGWGEQDLLGRAPVGRWPYAGTAYAGTAYAGTAYAGTAPGFQLLPTPRTTDVNGVGEHGQGGMDLRTAISLLKTPTAQLAINGGSQHPDKRKAGGHGPTLADEIEHLLPTEAVENMWGIYAQAVARQERAFGISAPPPTGPYGRGGARKLSGRFTEWMMTLDPGWITDVPRVSSNDAIRLCGNGVAPRQAEAALRFLAARSGVLAVAA